MVFQLSLLLLAGLYSGRSASVQDFEAPRFAVDLDADPLHRWDHVVAQFRQPMLAVEKIFKTYPEYKKLLTPVEALIRAESIVGEQKRWFIGDQFQELQGICKASGMEMTDLVALQIFYDLTAASSILPSLNNKECTSIVTENDAGEIVHGRNLDYDPELVDSMVNLTVTVDFQRGGATVYTAATYAGMVGFNTAMKPGRFSFSHDEREASSLLSNAWDVFVRHRVATFSLIRQITEAATSYADAVEQFKTAELPSTSYFILAGVAPGEGVIITRDQEAATADLLQLNASAGKWYIVETNYDHWDTPPKGDDRRGVAMRHLNATGRTGFSMEQMQEILVNKEYDPRRGERPTNNEMTVYSAVMRAAEPSHFRVTVHPRQKPVHAAVVGALIV